MPSCGHYAYSSLAIFADIGVVHDVSSFEQYFAPTCWLYEKSSEQVRDRCIDKRTDFPLEMVRMTPLQKEISPGHTIMSLA